MTSAERKYINRLLRNMLACLIVFIACLFMVLFFLSAQAQGQVAPSARVVALEQYDQNEAAARLKVKLDADAAWDEYVSTLSVYYTQRPTKDAVAPPQPPRTITYFKHVNELLRLDGDDAHNVPPLARDGFTFKPGWDNGFIIDDSLHFLIARTRSAKEACK